MSLRPNHRDENQRHRHPHAKPALSLSEGGGPGQSARSVLDNPASPGSRALNPDSCSSLLLTPGRTVIGYKCGPMKDAATRREKGVRDRRGGGGRCAENTKKILNSGNKPKESLKIQDLAFSGAKNEPEINLISVQKTAIEAEKQVSRAEFQVSGARGKIGNNSLSM